MSDSARPGELTAQFVPVPAPPEQTIDAPLESLQAPQTTPWANGVPRAPAPKSSPIPLPKQLGGYAVQEEIGRGGMGVVYRVHDADLNRSLAVKVLLADPRQHPDLHQRFLEEAQIMGQLQHPGVAPIHALGQLEDGRPFFTMKQIKGRTLAELLRSQKSGVRSAETEPEASAKEGSTAADNPLLASRRSPRSDLPRFLVIFEQICQTLGAAHARGIIHRDLKPANIMVGAFGEVQVMDWGLAKRMTDYRLEIANPTNPNTETLTANIQSEISKSLYEGLKSEIANSQLTEAGTVLGTPSYMPPEQARGEVESLDERSDVFGLGAILCEILTGQPPFAGKTRIDCLRQAMSGTITEALARLDGCGVDADLVQVAKTCLAAKKEDRPRNGGEVAAAVAQFQAGMQQRLQQAEIDTAAAQVKAAEERKRRTVKRTLAAVLTIFFLAAGAVGVWYYQDQAVRAIEADNKIMRRGELEAELAAKFVELTKQRAKLHKELSMPSGASNLMSDIDGWQVRVDKLHEVWKQAESTWKGGNDLLDETWKAKLDAQKKLVEDDAQDLELVRGIDEVRAKLYDLAEGKYQFDKAAKKYADVFKALELDVINGDPAAVAAKIAQLPLCQILVAALDHWSQLVPEGSDLLARRLLDIAKRADPDPWRDQVRDEIFGKNLTKLEKLARDYQPGGGTPQLLMMLAKKLNDNEKLAGSALLQKAILAQPKDFWLYFSLANLVKDPVAKAGYYQAALALRPNSAAAHNNIGITYYDRKDYDQAIVHFKTAIAVSPEKKYATAETNWGLALYKKKDLDGAMAHFKSVIAYDPTHPLAYNNMGLVYRDQKDLDKAIECLNRAIKFDAKLTNPHLNLGLIFQEQKNLDAAIAQFQEAIDKSPKSATGHNYFGMVLREKKDLPGAIKQFIEAIAKDPDNAQAYQNLGLMFQEQRDWGNAVLKYNKALALDPNLPRSHGGLAAALFFTGETKAAIVHYKKALEIDPSLTKTYATLGNALFAAKAAGDVGGTPSKSSPANLDTAIAFYQQGVELADLRDWQGAVAAYQKALLLDPDFALAHCSLGLCLQQQGKFAEALKSLQKGHELGSKNNLWDQPSADWISKCQRLLELEQKLPAILNGKAKAKDAAEKIELAYLCGHFFKSYAPAVRFYQEAFTADPKLADYASHYNAACYAALGGTGHGKEYPPLSAMEKAKLRQQALDWLREELENFTQSLRLDSSRAGNVQVNMMHWQADPDFADVRAEKELTNLPQAERKAWQQFWSDVAALLEQAKAAAKKD